MYQISHVKKNQHTSFLKTDNRCSSPPPSFIIEGVTIGPVGKVGPEEEVLKEETESEGELSDPLLSNDL